MFMIDLVVGFKECHSLSNNDNDIYNTKDNDEIIKTTRIKIIIITTTKIMIITFIIIIFNIIPLKQTMTTNII